MRISWKYWVTFILLLLLGIGYIFEKWVTKIELESLPLKGKLYDIDGSFMHIQCVGKGAPTVVLESGLGSDMNSWNGVFENISNFTQVCRYDRRGYGRSEANPNDSTIENQISDLSQLLIAAKITGPKILVGHSAGGLYAQHFAKATSEVVGIILVDSSMSLSAEEFDQFFGTPSLKHHLKEIGSKFGIERIKQVLFSQESVDEKIQNFSGSRYIEALYKDEAIYVELLRAPAVDLENLPLIVISRGKDFLNNGSPKSNFDTAWDNWQKRLLDLSSSSTQILADQSGHIIQNHQPEIIVDAIKEVWNEYNKNFQ